MTLAIHADHTQVAAPCQTTIRSLESLRISASSLTRMPHSRIRYGSPCGHTTPAPRDALDPPSTRGRRSLQRACFATARPSTDSTLVFAPRTAPTSSLPWHLDCCKFNYSISIRLLSWNTESTVGAVFAPKVVRPFGAAGLPNHGKSLPNS